MSLRKNPERVAWIILSIAFVAFCFLAVSIPLGIRWYIINATQVHKTSLAAIRGTVQVQEPDVNKPFAFTGSKDDVPEGSIITTDATSQAFLEFFEDSTLQLYNNSQVIIQKTQSPRFDLSPRPDTIALEVTGGRVRIGVAPSMQSDLHFQVQSPHVAVELKEDGSYSIEVTSEESQLTVSRGQAKVTAMGKTVELGRGERTTVEIGREPLGPLPPERNLIVNGDFRESLEKGWFPYSDRDDPNEAHGRVEIVTSGARQAVLFQRLGGNIYRGDTGIIQAINRDVRDYRVVELRLSVMLLYQSLSGGGVLHSEYPIMVRLDYKDAYGNPNHWVQGFYYENPANYPISDGLEIPRNVWYSYESGNLMEILGDVKPADLTSIRIYASGHDYQSMVTEVELLAKE
ncbi:MAG: FecR domain-containing protein [Chloroflexi bacterium]|nr:FecR domain-containing protein [Chloroflexota bacterium]